MVIIKKALRLLVIFLISFILSVIIHPKPLCSFTHQGGWGCSSFFPFLWLEEMKFKGELGFDIFFLHFHIGKEATFDLLLSLSIAVLTTLLFVVIYKSIIAKKLGRTKLISFITFIIIWYLVRAVLGYPYSLFDLDSDWRENPPYFRPIFGGYE